MTQTLITPKAAKKRYVARMLGASLGYVGAIIGAAFLVKSGDPVTLVTVLVALVPAAFIIMMLLAVWRYVSDVDEVARHDYISAMMIALFGVLALSGSWGLVEMFNEDLPRLPVFWVFPVFFALFGIVSSVRFRRCL